MYQVSLEWFENYGRSLRHKRSLLWKCLNYKKGHNFGTHMSGLKQVYDENLLFTEI